MQGIEAAQSFDRMPIFDRLLRIEAVPRFEAVPRVESCDESADIIRTSNTKSDYRLNRATET